jgi:hypothetical protein
LLLRVLLVIVLLQLLDKQRLVCTARDSMLFQYETCVQMAESCAKTALALTYHRLVTGGGVGGKAIPKVITSIASKELLSYSQYY